MFGEMHLKVSTGEICKASGGVHDVGRVTHLGTTRCPHDVARLLPQYRGVLHFQDPMNGVTCEVEVDPPRPRRARGEEAALWRPDMVVGSIKASGGMGHVCCVVGSIEAGGGRSTISSPHHLSLKSYKYDCRCRPAMRSPHRPSFAAQRPPRGCHQRLMARPPDVAEGQRGWPSQVLPVQGNHKVVPHPHAVPPPQRQPIPRGPSVLHQVRWKRTDAL